MSAHVRVGRDAAAQTVAVKSAPIGADPARLVHEAAVLALARQPGVVEARRLRLTADGPELELAWVGTRSLAVVDAMSPGELASVMAAVCETVADLHSVGIVHASLGEASHVLLDSHGRPVLCGFGDAVLIDEEADPTLDSHRPSADVAALGELLIGLVTCGEPARPLVPLRRPWRSRGDDDAIRRALYIVAEQARAEDPSCRPSARALARALRDLSPTPQFVRLASSNRSGAVQEASDSLPTELTAVGQDDPLARLRATATGIDPRPARPRTRLVAGSVSVLIGLFALGSWLSTSSGGTTVADEPSVQLRAPRRAEPTTTTTATISLPASSGPHATLAHEPPVVDHHGRSFQIGAPGDQVLIDDWKCAGERAALLRPSTGEIWAFPAWADAEVDVVAVLVETTPSGARLAPRLDDLGCAQLMLVDEQGATHPVDLGAALGQP